MFFSGIGDEAGKSIDLQIKAHLELGWRHIELRNVDGVNATLLDATRFDTVADKIRTAGLQVSCFASAIANWSRDIADDFGQDVAELRQAIPRMKKLAVPLIRVMSWKNERGASEAEWRDAAIRRLRELTKIAEGEGVLLAHENCTGWGGRGHEQTLELLAAVDSPSLRIVFDTGNPVIYNQNSWEYYRGIVEHIAYVHIKDAERAADGKTHFTFAGEGDGCVREICADLKKRGYDGGFSIEPHIASIVHEGKSNSPETLYRSYIEYGSRFVELFGKA